MSYKCQDCDIDRDRTYSMFKWAPKSRSKLKQSNLPGTCSSCLPSRDHSLCDDATPITLDRNPSSGVLRALKSAFLEAPIASENWITDLGKRLHLFASKISSKRHEKWTKFLVNLELFLLNLRRNELFEFCWCWFGCTLFGICC